jgi:hypothetical protein
MLARFVFLKSCSINNINRLFLPFLFSEWIPPQVSPAPTGKGGRISERHGRNTRLTGLRGRRRDGEGGGGRRRSAGHVRLRRGRRGRTADADGQGTPWPQYGGCRDGEGGGGTTRAAADSDDLPGTSAAVDGGGGGDNGRRGRTLTGKGRHVCNTEVDGTARARAAAGLRGLRSSPARAQIVAVRLHRWWRLRRRWQVRVDADGQGTRAGAMRDESQRTTKAGEGGR